MEHYSQRKILRFQDNQAKFLQDKLINQTELDLIVDGSAAGKIAALPENLVELALGNLFYQDYFRSMQQVSEYNLDLANQKFQLTLNEFPTPDKPQRSDFQEAFLNPTSIYTLMQKFTQSSELFTITGAVHSAALVLDNHIKFFADDIGRHNAIDKVIGKGLIQQIDFDNCRLYTSGRISPETVQKAINAGIPLIISHSAGMERSIHLAEESKIILIGFVRGTKLNIYCGWKNLKFED